MKINIKQGLRRIIITIIGFIAICFFVYYCSNGFIFDNYKLQNKVFIINKEKDKKITLLEFANIYLPKADGMKFNYWDIKCHPYKSYCTLENENNIFINNTLMEIEIEKPINNSSEDKLLSDFDQFKNWEDYSKEKKEIYFQMPSPFTYFTWQLFDFFLILFWSVLLYLFYLVIEFILIWIVRGFKNE